MREMIKMK